MNVVQKDYRRLNCWTYCDPCHSMFTCYILIGSNKCVLPIDTIEIKTSQIRWLFYSYKASVEIVLSLNPIVKRFVHLTDIIAMNTGNSMITAPKQSLKASQRKILCE